MTLETLIKNRLEDASKHCNFKEALIKCMHKRGWVFIKKSLFARELAHDIRQGQMTGEVE